MTRFGVVVSLRELESAGTCSAEDIMGGRSRDHTCFVCGLCPANIKHPKRPNPRAVLLERVEGRYRCRDRDACSRRGPKVKREEEK